LQVWQGFFYRATLLVSRAKTQSKRTNAALWWGPLLALLGVFSNGFYFLGVPARLVVGITLALPAVALAVLVVGLRRAFAQSNIYRGKVWDQS
jgi:hypothetical protein